jgi:hypothetical protein
MMMPEKMPMIIARKTRPIPTIIKTASGIGRWALLTDMTMIDPRNMRIPSVKVAIVGAKGEPEKDL